MMAAIQQQQQAAAAALGARAPSPGGAAQLPAMPAGTQLVRLERGWDGRALVGLLQASPWGSEPRLPVSPAVARTSPPCTGHHGAPAEPAGPDGAHQRAAGPRLYQPAPQL